MEFNNVLLYVVLLLGGERSPLRVSLDAMEPEDDVGLAESVDA